MKEPRWRTFGNMLRLPCQQATDWYFEVPENATKYRGNPRVTLPAKLHNDIVERNSRSDLEVKQFKTTENFVVGSWRSIFTKFSSFQYSVGTNPQPFRCSGQIKKGAPDEML